MHFILLLSVIFATSTGIIYTIGTPMQTARETQAKFDNYISTGYRTGVLAMLTSNFQFEDCKGKKYGPNEFADFVMSTATTGKVLEARADKNHIIYQVAYWAKVKQFMITKKINGWYMERGQDLIC